MSWKIILLVLNSFAALSIIILDYFSDKDTPFHWALRLFLFIITILLPIAAIIVMIKDDEDNRKINQGLRDSNHALSAEVEILKELQSKDLKLSQELMRASGMHETYPFFYFFRGSSIKMGTREMLESTIPVIIHNPGDYPIYDLDVQIVEVLEHAKWQSSLFTSKQKTDATGNVLWPDFVSTTFHFTALQARGSIQREIAAPPRETKTNYTYTIKVSARNGETTYKYIFVPKGQPEDGPLRFYDFHMAYKILRPERVKQYDGTFGFQNRVVDQGHDPEFPTSPDGTVDYGENILGIDA